MNPKNQGPILFKEESYELQGAAFAVYREMGGGFLEAVYQECLEKELTNRNIPFVSHPSLQLFYKTEKLTQTYKPDLICYNKIIIELKTVRELTPQHQAQVIHYLTATKFRLGLLINFASYPKATIKRLVR